MQMASCFERNQSPLLVEEVLVEQGADGAEVDDVAGEGVVDRLAGEDVDLGVVAARITCSSPVWVISRVNRTQRVHMMHRSWLSWIACRRRPCLGLTIRSSTKRWLAWPYS